MIFEMLEGIRRRLRLESVLESKSHNTTRHALLLGVGVFLFLIAIYLYKPEYRLLGGSTDTWPNELLPVSILREGDLDFDEFPEFTGWPDLITAFTVADGHVRSAYPIIPGLLNIPVYWIASTSDVDLMKHRQLLSLITASLLTALSGPFMFLILRRRASNITAAAFSVFYGIGTTAWGVASRAIWQHAPSLLFLSAALWLSEKHRTSARTGAAFLLGLAVITRPTNLILASGILLFVLAARSSRLLVISAFVVPIAGQLWYSVVIFHSPIEGFYPILSAGNYTFRASLSNGLAGILLSPSRGLLIFTPLFLFGLMELVYEIRHRNFNRIEPYLAISALVYLIVYGRWTTWWAGHSFGYRYLTELIPLLVLFTLLAWERTLKHSRIGVISFFMLAAVSIYVNALGGLLYPCGFNETLLDFIDVDSLWQVSGSEIDLCTQRLLHQMR